MCGIAAILSQDRSLDARLPVMNGMLSAIAHRGPDGDGTLNIADQAILGHKRLAVIDVEHGQQPMCSEDGRYSLIFNGEIYNYLELRQSLIQSGHRFETFSDTEVLLRLLMERGADAVNSLNGMFAFLFHDKHDNKWIAARDAFGIKPLYYVERNDELVFASEIKALLEHPDVRAERDNAALQQYLSLQFCLDDRTMFRDIRKIKPGFLLEGRGSQILEQRCYWDTNYVIDYYHTEDYFVDRLRGLLEDSMRIQIRSDVPVGGYLSGGIDSSLVCALAAGHLEAPMPVFHGRFDEAPAYDESRYAKIAAEAAGGIYNEITIGENEFVESIPALIRSLDEPLAGPGLFPQFCVSRAAREQVTVVLGGQGGDEIFGGYARYLVGYLEQAMKGAIFETQEEGEHLVTLESIIPQLPMLKQYRPLLSKFWREGLFDDMDARYFRLIDRSEDLQSTLNQELVAQFDPDALFAEFQAIFNHPDTASYINKMTHFDQKTLLPALLQVEDRVSMSVSLEARVPLLDTRIVDLVTTMPPPLKFQGGRSKQVLKKATQSVLPKAVLDRKDKMGFPVPLNEWMQGGPVRDFVADVLLSKASLDRGIFRREALQQLIGEQTVGARQLWGALSLELWHREFIDG